MVAEDKKLAGCKGQKVGWLQRSEGWLVAEVRRKDVVEISR
jgi:hypothetical protein